jgi:hypothetical protein
MDEFNEIVKNLSIDKEKYEKMFDGADEIEDITFALEHIINDNELWTELAKSKADRIGMVALIGSFAIQFTGAIEPIVDEFLDKEDEYEEEFGDDDED